MSNWDDLRTHLNHDILRNQVLNEVLMLENSPSSSCPRLEMWIKNRKMYEQLIDNVEYETSYARVIETEIFACYSVSTKLKISDLLHPLFLRMTGVSVKKSDCRQVLHEAIEMSEKFLAKRPSERTVSEVQEIIKVLHELSTNISRLPSSVSYLRS